MANIFGLDKALNDWDKEQLEKEIEWQKMQKAQMITGLGAYAHVVQKYVRPKGVISVQALQNNPIFTSSLQTLKDLWRVKFPGWVDPTKLEEEHSFMYQAIMHHDATAFDSWKVVDEDTGFQVIAIKLKDDANPSQ